MKALISKTYLTNQLSTGQLIEFLENHVYIISEQFEEVFRLTLAKNGEDFDKHMHVEPLENVIKPFNFANTKGVKEVILIRAGGIGDIIAASAIQKFIAQKGFNTSFMSMERYKPVLNWFHHYPLPLSTYDTIGKYKHGFRHFAQISLQGIVNNTSQNWYETIAAKANIPFIEKLGRPGLKTKFKNVSNNFVIISHRASTNIRSMRFQDIYLALKEARPELDEIYVFESELTTEDTKFLKVNGENVTVISSVGLSDYLVWLQDAKLVISTDTAAIHFREGLQKPAIGIYNAMSVESRTKYYKYTYSFDVVSDCDYQPCFTHNVNGKDEVCKLSKPGELIAPCLNSKVFTPDLHTQLVKHFKNYKF